MIAYTIANRQLGTRGQKPEVQLAPAMMGDDDAVAARFCRRMQIVGLKHPI